MRIYLHISLFICIFAYTNKIYSMKLTMGNGTKVTIHAHARGVLFVCQ